MGIVTHRLRAPSSRLVVVVALTVVFTVLGLGTVPPGDTPTELWASLAAAFVWTTVVWDGRSRPPRGLAVHLVAQVLLVVVVAAAFGWAFTDSAWIAVANVGGGVLMAVLYARISGVPGWAPTTAWSNVALLLAGLGASVFVVLLAGFPNLELGELDRLAVWWTVRDLAYAYIGGVTLLFVFFAERRHHALPAPRWAVALLVPLGAACVGITYSDPELPLTWFLLLPAVVAGSILTPRGAAGYSLFVAVLTALAALHPINQFGYNGLFPGSVIIDLLLTASTFITIHLAILRAQRVEAAEELEAQRRSRLSELTGFAGVVAHDLRGPLGSLHGWLELAEDALGGGDVAGAAEFMSRAQVSSARMRQVIEDWLAYTVQRDGVLTITEVPLEPLLEELIAPYEASDAGLAPEFELRARHSVEADRALTRQLLANLVGNAVKYGRDGEPPRVTVESMPDQEEGFVRIEVSDRGIGLPPGEEESVFDEFHRAAAHADSFAGTGLGLSLCRRIVDRHGGSIHARTNAHGGATFSFTLPAAASQPGRDRPTPVPAGAAHPLT